MRRQRYVTVAAGVLLVLAAGVGSGQSVTTAAPSLERLVRAAMARDDELAQQQLKVRDRQLGVAQRGAAKDFGLALKLKSPEHGIAGLTAGFGEEVEFDPHYGIDTSLEANLPHPFGSISTTASFSGPVEEAEPRAGFLRCSEQQDDRVTGCEKVPEKPAEKSPWDLAPVVSIGLKTRMEQPLGPLLGLDASPGDDLEAAHGVMQAERGVRQRIRAITRDLLERMITILERRIAERRSLHAIAELEDEVVRRRDVFQDNERSHGFQSKLFKLEQERRRLDTTQFLLRQDLVAFEQRTGAPDFGPLAEARLALPAAADAARAPDVVDATVDLRVSEHRIREDDSGRWPEVTLNAGYDWRQNELSAGVGFAFTLPILDGGLQRIRAERLDNAVKAAELAGSVARREFEDALAGAERRIRDLDYRAWEHREHTRLAALKVVETRAALEAGIIVPSELAQVELDHELLAFEGQVLRAQRWQLKLDLDALTDADPLDFAAAR